MFITIRDITHHVSDDIGEVLLSAGSARKATAKEAAECIDRLIVNGDPAMGEANAEFESLYAKGVL